MMLFLLHLEGSTGSHLWKAIDVEMDPHDRSVVQNTFHQILTLYLYLLTYHQIPFPQFEIFLEGSDNPQPQGSCLNDIFHVTSSPEELERSIQITSSSNQSWYVSWTVKVWPKDLHLTESSVTWLTGSWFGG